MLVYLNLMEKNSPWVIHESSFFTVDSKVEIEKGGMFTEITNST